MTKRAQPWRWKRLTTEEILALDPGVREVVAWLSNDLMYRTCDSGDGKSKAALGWPEGEFLDYPHVYVQCRKEETVRTAHLIMQDLREAGVEVDAVGTEGKVWIQASIDPTSDKGFVEISHLDDATLARARAKTVGH